jgi:hypothetical protein
MEDSPSEEASIYERHPVTERELMESLNRSLWEVERRRAEDAAQRSKS